MKQPNYYFLREYASVRILLHELEYPFFMCEASSQRNANFLSIFMQQYFIFLPRNIRAMP